MVDGNGWNTMGKIYPTTTLRARASLGVVRASILEIALRPTDSGSRDTILYVEHGQPLHILELKLPTAISINTNPKLRPISTKLRTLRARLLMN